MFCFNCGAKAFGNFCSACGQKLIAPESAAQVTAIADPTNSPADWKFEHRYDILLDFPEVRNLIAKYSVQAKKAISAEELLDLAEKVYKPIPGVSMQKASKIVNQLYARMGIQTGKEKKKIIAKPIGESIVVVLCSLARTGRPLKEVHQAEDGCVIEATVPSGIGAFEGAAIIALHRQSESTFVEATAKTPGQIYDWGRSQKVLDDLFQDLDRSILTGQLQGSSAKKAA